MMSALTIAPRYIAVYFQLNNKLLRLCLYTLFDNLQSQ